MSLLLFLFPDEVVSIIAGNTFEIAIVDECSRCFGAVLKVLPKKINFTHLSWLNTYPKKHSRKEILL